VTADLETTDRHLLVVGDPGTGRSTVLAAVGRALEDADCWLVDPRGSLEAVAARSHQVGRTPQQIETLLSDLHAHLLATLNVQGQPRRRLLLVDDLDVATTLTSAHGWSALATLLPLAPDLRLTVAVARRCAGMARTAYEPFLGALRDSGATGVLLGGSSDEGPIVGGVRCRPAPVGRALLVRPGRPPRPLQLYADPPDIPGRSPADGRSNAVDARDGVVRPPWRATATPGAATAVGTGSAQVRHSRSPHITTNRHLDSPKV
jgi:S-DNA-T family DNA segregation ATPase FtsK/SpoIIIE